MAYEHHRSGGLPQDPAPGAAAQGHALPSPEYVDIAVDDATDALADLRAGLEAPQARIAPKYFYDALGARLFEAITRLPEYYLTRVEAQLMDTLRPQLREAITAHCGPAPVQLLDLGAGSCRKAQGWIDTLRVERYVAVDIARDMLAEGLAALQRANPTLPLVGVSTDFSRRLDLRALDPGQASRAAARIALYPGSSIGNFAPEAARAFLRQVAQCCPGGGLVIGVDLVKDTAILEAAYNDALGVTAAFNRNVLLHVNALLGSDFHLQDWDHAATYARDAGRIEMHLVARRALELRWPGGQRRFAAAERIHTENSYKWEAATFSALLRAAGFGEPRCWTDAQGLFAVFWAPVPT